MRLGEGERFCPPRGSSSAAWPGRPSSFAVVYIACLQKSSEDKDIQQNPEAVSLLTPEQYRVTQQDGTERPFQNEYWDNKEPGLYVDVVSGEPLFASVDKFDSGTGWPSFTKPLEPGNVVESVDGSHGTTGTEVRSRHGNSHLVLLCQILISTSLSFSIHLR